MFHSLRFRLFLTLLIVVVVAVGTVALFMSWATRVGFQNYVEQDTQRDQQLMDTLLRYYTLNREIEDPQAMVDQMAQIMGEQILLVGKDGKVIADSNQQQKLTGQMLNCGANIPAIIVALGPPPCLNVETAGIVDRVDDRFEQLNNSSSSLPLILRRPVSSEFDTIGARFISSVNNSLLLAATAAGLVALFLSTLLSRRILAPIETLTATARKMEKGDLSQRVQIQSKDEIGDLTHAFNAMADGLARLEQLRRNMVTDVAHELRTPLTNIRGYLEAVRDGIAEPEPALINSLHEEAMLLNRLVDDLQELALAEAGQLSLVCQSVAPRTIIEKAVSALQPSLTDKGLTLQVNLPPDLPTVEADSERIGQVLRNLLNNAMIHTPPGGAIDVSATSTDEEVVISVRDTGVGIAAEHLPYIFERFFRADHSRTRSTGGFGLGLTIVKQLVESHGGQIWAESTPGKGSVFTFTIPVAQE